MGYRSIKRGIAPIAATLVATVCTFLAPSSEAVPMNPDPGTFAADNGAELFEPASFISLKSIDFGELFAGVSEFGFFYDGFPGSRVTLFDAGDPLAAGVQVASADFIGGSVTDVDTAVAETAFAVAPLPIGFYYTILGMTYYSVSSLNAGGEDLVGVFPTLDGTAHLIGFSAPGSSDGIAFMLNSGLTPLAAPEPGMLALLLAGIGGFIPFRRRNRSAQAA